MSQQNSIAWLANGGLISNTVEASALASQARYFQLKLSKGNAVLITTYLV